MTEQAVENSPAQVLLDFISQQCKLKAVFVPSKDLRYDRSRECSSNVLLLWWSEPHQLDKSEAREYELDY